MVSHVDPQDKIAPPHGCAAGVLMVSVQVVRDLPSRPALFSDVSNRCNMAFYASFPVVSSNSPVATMHTPSRTTATFSIVTRVVFFDLRSVLLASAPRFTSCERNIGKLSTRALMSSWPYGRRMLLQFVRRQWSKRLRTRTAMTTNSMIRRLTVMVMGRIKMFRCRHRMWVQVRARARARLPSTRMRASRI